MPHIIAYAGGLPLLSVMPSSVTMLCAAATGVLAFGWWAHRG